MNALIKKISDLHNRSKGGISEAMVATAVVGILQAAGWRENQINQDVSLTPNGADKADIVVCDNTRPIIIEVKRGGNLAAAADQIDRYCRLIKPQCRFALATDGMDWELFYIGLQRTSHLVRLFKGESESEKLADSLSGLKKLYGPRGQAKEHFAFLDFIESEMELNLSKKRQDELGGYFRNAVWGILLASKVGHAARKAS